MSKSLSIVFMGTPEFAVASLDALVKSRHKVLAVVTAPDRPASRGLKLQQSAVKEYALKNNLPVLQPEKLKSEEFIYALRQLNADAFVVVAFRMLPEVVWKMPKMGTINLHASLLPKYRGAAPINWAIINGEKTTGVTTFFINQDIDKGDIINQRTVPVLKDDTAGSMHDKLMEIGATLVVQTVDALEGLLSPEKKDRYTISQNEIPSGAVSHLNPAPKIFKQDCKIDWNKPAEQVRNFIRGLSPYPAAWTEIVNKEGKKLGMKIYSSLIKPGMSLLPGELIIEDDVHIYIGCKDEAVEIKELQLEGRKTMPVADFLRGFKLKEGGWKVII